MNQEKIENAQSNHLTLKKMWQEEDIRHFLEKYGFKSAQDISENIQMIQLEAYEQSVNFFKNNIAILLSEKSLKCLYPRFGLEWMVQDITKVLLKLLALRSKVLKYYNPRDIYQNKLLTTFFTNGLDKFFETISECFDCRDPKSLLYATKTFHAVLKDSKKYCSILENKEKFVEELIKAYKTVVASEEAIKNRVNIGVASRSTTEKSQPSTSSENPDVCRGKVLSSMQRFFLGKGISSMKKTTFLKPQGLQKI